MESSKTTKSQDRQAAQVLAYKAMDAGDSAKAMRLCLEALKLDPRCVDALVLVGRMLSNLDDCIAHLSQAVQIATEDLGGEQYLRENKGCFWGLRETRPYMRARLCLAQALHAAGKPEAAIAEYEVMLQLNPNDNQGLRYPLIGLYLEIGDLGGARRLQDEYAEDDMAVFAWSAVLERLIAGDTAGAKQALSHGRQVNPYVESYLIGTIAMPRELSGYHGSGDVNEAVFCTYILGHAWVQHPPALKWLRRQQPLTTTAATVSASRNDPCPCGSGKKYKKCCLGQPSVTPSPVASSSGAHEQMLREIQQALEGREFSSDQEMNAFIQEFNHQHNQRPIDDFEGLSAEQMSLLLYFPFDSPQVVEFPPVLAAPPAAPISALFALLVEAIGAAGLQPTATGNLPLKVVHLIARAYLGETGYAEYTMHGSIRSELDYPELHTTRFVAESAGLIRKYKGKFILSSHCRELLKQAGIQAVYPLLLRTYALKVDWASSDCYPELGIIQDSFAFSLYLLDRFGSEWHESAFYENAFLKAFPRILDEATPSDYETREDVVREAYTLRCLTRFAEFMGLVESRTKASQQFSRNFKLRKTPLLGAAVKFVSLPCS